ncbi:hypothetical protein F4781DRAFT_380370 [Annulohypoxylon bovei var. microspora]|nr:hypothetical protein F4781DRAFT_380370 [Annulohypoxylon bovei var. microspora]
MSKKPVHTKEDNHLTLVGARNTKRHKTCRKHSHADWPSPDDYQEAKGHLPLPRTWQLDSRYLHLSYDQPSIPIDGPAVPRAHRKVTDRALIPAYGGISTKEVFNLHMSDNELVLEEINPATRELIHFIDGINYEK